MFESELLGMREAMYTAAVTTHGEHIWFINMDNEGEGGILTRDQMPARWVSVMVVDFAFWSPAYM